MDVREFNFDKDRYIFSKERHIRKVRKKIPNECIQLFINELKKYKIYLIKLSKKEISQEERNLVLNIALYIYEDERILNYIRKKRTLPFNSLSEKIDVDIDFLLKWKEYILAYVILAYDDKYIDIYDYLDVNFKELENVNVKKTYVDINIYRGVVLETYKNGTIILTSSGEFININKGNEVIGTDICGRKKLGLKPYKKLITSTVLIIFIISSFSFYYYGKEKSTIIIQGTSQIKFSINNFNKVTYGYSATEKGKLLLSKVKWEKKSVNVALDNIFSMMQELNMIPKDRKLEVIVTGKKLKDSSVEGILNYVNNINGDEDMENNIKIIMNNSGDEAILK